ncbi:MAG: DNA polymerase III subunit gamma/tau [Actinobacteria bacterium]|nr:DNA polymerase III subunit gamma/tau [Actinomycetota bacterium]MBE3113981.1 DNA polymerase III subunit gamma/tau [Actinomycetota bacterium]
MGYISFYRKWRPQDFGEIIGQEYNVRTIKNAISNNRLSHCYIFCGPRGTGKTSTARILAKALNCIKGTTPDPCNKCENCISISDGYSMDVVEIDAASNRGINEIRELREKVKYLPNILRKKVYIIDEVHMLTTEAFNALLKVLEEPPDHVLFIMATTEPNKVIPTIMSRCQRFDFFPIPMDKIKERLQKIAKSEKITISDSALSLISKYADGSLRDADGILEQLAAFGEDKIELRDVISLLGVTDLDMLFEFTDILIEKNLTGGLLLVNKIIGSNQNLKVFVSEFLDHLYDLYVIKNYNNPFEIVNISEDYKDKYLDQAKKLQKEEIEFYMELFTDLLKQIKWGEGSKVFFKSAVVRAINFIVLDEKEIGKKTRLMETQIESLRKEIDKINSIQEGNKNYHNHRADVGTSVYENEEDDFDILNSNEIDKMVSEVEIQSKHKVSGGKAHKSEMADAGVEKKDEEISLINNNLDKISQSLKKKKISVHAMFTEAVPYKIENGTLYFYLDKEKEWHKDHLNKIKNIELISSVIKEVTGKGFKIKFELGKKMDKIDVISDAESEASSKLTGESKAEDAESEASNSLNSKDRSSENSRTEEDVFNYFEKKFDIKE